MANQEQLEILKKGVGDWYMWRRDNPDVEVDLARADLSGANLGRANLSGADLSGADLTGANLRGARLGRADLSGADLIGAHLRGADLTQANLIRANLSGADLPQANLRGADLTQANLIGADLTQANLIRADLRRANLIEVDLRRADLTGSQVGLTTFGSNDLSTSIGLETIRHNRPSTVGTDTLQQSKGKIPIEFLRGCGLSDLDIEYAKLAAPGLDPEQVTKITYEIHSLYFGQPIQFYSCFISYNSKDHSFAQRLHDDLQDNGVRCWFAPEDMKIGDEFRKAIGEQIRVREKLLIILSENSIQSEWVGDEVEKALAEEKEQGKPKLFPIRLDDAIFKTRDDWAEKIRLRRHIGDFSTDYDKGLERLLRDLKPQS